MNDALANRKFGRRFRGAIAAAVLMISAASASAAAPDLSVNWAYGFPQGAGISASGFSAASPSAFTVNSFGAGQYSIPCNGPYAASWSFSGSVASSICVISSAPVVDMSFVSQLAASGAYYTISYPPTNYGNGRAILTWARPQGVGGCPAGGGSICEMGLARLKGAGWTNQFGGWNKPNYNYKGTLIGYTYYAYGDGARNYIQTFSPTDAGKSFVVFWATASSGGRWTSNAAVMMDPWLTQSDPPTQSLTLAINGTSRSYTINQSSPASTTIAMSTSDSFNLSWAVANASAGSCFVSGLNSGYVWTNAAGNTGARAGVAASNNDEWTIGCPGLSPVKFVVQAWPAAALSLSPSTPTPTVGTPFTLTFSSNAYINKNSCAVTGPGYSNGNALGAAVWNGSAYTASASVTPASAGAITYTMTCTGLDLKPYSTATTVTAAYPPPTGSIAVSPASITLGSAHTVTWSSTNAASCSVASSPAGFTASGTSGSQNRTPGAVGSITYTVTCTGLSGGTTTASATGAVVYPPASLSITASPSAIFTNSSFTLTWAATNAASCSVASAPAGFTSSGTSGSAAIQPTLAGTYTYTLSCTGLNGASAQKTATVAVTDMQCDFTLDTDTVALSSGTAQASWNTNIPDGCELTGTNIDGGSGQTTVAYPAIGSATLGPYGTTGTFVYSLACPRAATGPALCTGTKTVTVFDPTPPPPPDLPALPPVVGSAADPGSTGSGTAGQAAASAAGVAGTGMLRSVIPFDYPTFCVEGAKARTAAWLANCNFINSR